MHSERPHLAALSSAVSPLAFTRGILGGAVGVDSLHTSFAPSSFGGGEVSVSVHVVHKKFATGSSAALRAVVSTVSPDFNIWSIAVLSPFLAAAPRV